MSEIAKTTGSWAVARSGGEAWSMAQRLAASQIVPTSYRGKPDDIFVAMMAGERYRVDPLTALTDIHVIEGKPTLSASLMVALVRASGVCEYWIASCSGDVATVRTRRAGEPEEQSATFSTADAKAAGLLSKKNWQSYREDMLIARAASRLARRVYPDVIKGAYVHGELDAEPTGQVIDAEVVVEDTPDPRSAVLDSAGKTYSEITGIATVLARRAVARRMVDLAKADGIEPTPDTIAQALQQLCEEHADNAAAADDAMRDYPDMEVPC